MYKQLGLRTALMLFTGKFDAASCCERTSVYDNRGGF